MSDSGIREFFSHKVKSAWRLPAQDKNKS